MTRKSDERGPGSKAGKPAKGSKAERERASPGGENREESDLDAQLDEELEDSFPASDPPSLTQDPKQAEDPD